MSNYELEHPDNRSLDLEESFEQKIHYTTHDVNPDGIAEILSDIEKDRECARIIREQLLADTPPEDKLYLTDEEIAEGKSGYTLL
jgi:hypothetical protein